MFRYLHYIHLALSVLLISNACLAQPEADNARSDTLDVIHTDINLEVHDFNGKSIRGDAVLTIVSKMNGVSTVNLDLLKLTVDSVVEGKTLLSHSYNDTLLQVFLASSLNQGDTVKLTVFYRGNPQIDQSNWGGFYFNAGYAFNLGVGFAADPHNYGRVWFPCFDNFVERSTYLFNIFTSNGKKAHCSGYLVSESTLNGDTIVRTWKMDDPIPSYLVGMAIGDYETVHLNYAGSQGNVPIELAAKANDTTNAKNAFLHLNDAMAAFEFNFGPFLFNKVGYSFVPFNSGAMEHATNIAYPLYAISGGGIGSETLMAHELAHHWWGDLVTCRTAEDMWINEGMASYCEHLFLEHTYGSDTFKIVVKDNLDAVLQYAHVREDMYRAVSGVPHEYTYGMHVYDKGAVVSHNLRTYLGDSLYQSGMKYFLDKYKFSDVSSELIRDELSSFTGINLNNFFDDWIFSAGFSHFQIDSVSSNDIGGGNYDVDIHVRQKLKGANQFHTGVPVLLTLWDENWIAHEYNEVFSGQNTVITKTTDYEPIFATLNADDQLNLALAADEMVISETGEYEFPYGRMNISVTDVQDSALIRVEHHWVAPDSDNLPGNATQISDYRYWTVQGIGLENLNASAEISYDGRNTLSNRNGQLDKQLLESGEDSVILLHRKDASENWREYQYYSKNTLVTTLDKFGIMELSQIMEGEYALAVGSSVVGVKKKLNNVESALTIQPNPSGSHDLVTISIDNFTGNATMELIGLEGKIYKQATFSGIMDLNVKGMANGTYLVIIRNESGSLLSSAKLVIQD